MIRITRTRTLQALRQEVADAEQAAATYAAEAEQWHELYNQEIDRAVAAGEEMRRVQARRVADLEAALQRTTAEHTHPPEGAAASIASAAISGADARP